MYVTIDRSNLRVMRKHQNQRALSYLTVIEAPHVVTTVCCAYGVTFLHGYTDLEKRKLYCNLTGEKTCVWSGDHITAVLMELVQRLPEDNINPIEVRAQASRLADGDDEIYIYVPGKLVPQAAPDLFEFAYPKVARRLHDDEVTLAANHKGITKLLYPDAEEQEATALARVQAEIAQAATHTAAPTRSGSTAGTSAPRTAGVRDKVWSVADAMWTAAGKPTDPKAVLALRKEIMNTLEREHDVKRTSSSNELGNWQKNRI